MRRTGRARRLAVALACALLAGRAAALPETGAASEAGAGAVPAAARDWHTARDEAAELLGRLVRLDTTNPPGAEAPAAELLAGWLEARGVPARVLAFAPGRANVLARLPATDPDGSAPLLLLGHLDVVPADVAAWSFPPRAGRVADGALRGRGALDDKGHLAVFAEALALLARDGAPRHRALVLAATGGEEVDGAGVLDLIEHHWQALGPPDAVWNEGGATAPVALLDGRLVNGIAVSEKRALWMELVAEGEGGHGSQPLPGSAVERLARAAARVAAWRTPPRLTDTVRAQLAALADAAPFPRNLLLRYAARPWLLRLLDARLSEDRLTNAMVRDTVAVTGLRAGIKHNVIPREARAWLDVRLLPDTDVGDFLTRLRDVIDDPSVRVEGAEAPSAPPASPVDHPLFAAIAAEMARELPGSVTVPLQTSGATDSSFFRMRGVPAYGFQPAVLTPELNASIHGPDERLPLEELERGVRVTTRVLKRLTRR